MHSIAQDYGSEGLWIAFIEKRPEKSYAQFRAITHTEDRDVKDTN